MTRERWAAAGMAGVLVLVAAVPGIVGYSAWAGEQAMKRAWAVEGPACPVTQATPAPFGRMGPKTFDYGGASFSRRYGHVDCMAATEGAFGGELYRVCQFTAPAVVAVNVGGRTQFFRPGVGRPATVTVRRGQASCVVGGWFKG